MRNLYIVFTGFENTLNSDAAITSHSAPAIPGLHNTHTTNCQPGAHNFCPAIRHPHQNSIETSSVVNSGPDYRLTWAQQRIVAMDITSFVLQGRDNALAYGDYSTYHSQLAKRLLSSRKKLGIASRNRGKFHNTEAITSENISENHE